MKRVNSTGLIEYYRLQTYLYPMRKKLLLLSALSLWCAQSFAAPATSYQTCLNSLREDGHAMIAEINDTLRVVYLKKSTYDRDLFVVDTQKFYSCGELSIQSPTSTEDVLNFDAILLIGKSPFPIMAEIPNVLTFGAEDFVIRDGRASNGEKLNCVEITSSQFDPAFVETVGARLKGFSIEFKETIANKKNQERSGIWGPGWSAKSGIESDRNSYLKVLKSCSAITALKELSTSVVKELKSLK